MTLSFFKLFSDFLSAEEINLLKALMRNKNIIQKSDLKVIQL